MLFQAARQASPAVEDVLLVLPEDRETRDLVFYALKHAI